MKMTGKIDRLFIKVEIDRLNRPSKKMDRPKILSILTLLINKNLDGLKYGFGRSKIWI